jgi:hypothetical protein
MGAGEFFTTMGCLYLASGTLTAAWLWSPHQKVWQTVGVVAIWPVVLFCLYHVLRLEDAPKRKKRRGLR